MHMYNVLTFERGQQYVGRNEMILSRLSVRKSDVFGTLAYMFLYFTLIGR